MADLIPVRVLNGTSEEFYKQLAIIAVRSDAPRHAEIHLARDRRPDPSKERLFYAGYVNGNSQIIQPVRRVVRRFKPLPYREGSDERMHGIVIRIADVVGLLSSRETLCAMRKCK